MENPGENEARPGLSGLARCRGPESGPLLRSLRVAHLKRADIPEEVATFEALAVWVFLRLARLAQSRTLPIGEQGEMLAAASVFVFEAANGRTYARLEAFPPIDLARLNAPDEGTWMSAGALVGVSDPVEPAAPPPPPPPPPFDPLSLAFLDLWEPWRPETVSIVDGKVSAVANRVEGRQALAQPTVSRRPTYEPALVNGKGGVAWPSSNNPAFLFTSGSYTVKEIYLVLRYQNTANVFAGYDGIITHRNNAVNPWAIGNSGGTGLYLYNSQARLYINANQESSRPGNLFPEIRQMCVLRLLHTGAGFTTANGVALGMDRDFWIYDRGFKGEVMFCGMLAEPLSEENRGKLLPYLLALAGVAA